jgi:hypothetical protein
VQGPEFKPQYCQKKPQKTKNLLGWTPVAHAYNPSYSGGRDQEDRGSEPARANSLQDPNLKKTHHKKRLVEQLKVRGPEFKFQY